VRGGAIGGHDHALPGRQTVGLHDDRTVGPLGEGGTRCGGVGIRGERRRRDAGLDHERLREALARLDARGLARGADDRHAGPPDRVADAGSDEIVGANDDEIDRRGSAMLLDARDIRRREVEDPREERHRGVARRDVDRRDARASREAPGDRVLAPAAAEDQAVEAGAAMRAAGAAVRAVLLDDPLDPVAPEQEILHRGSLTPMLARSRGCAASGSGLVIIARRGGATAPSLPFDRRRRL